MLPAQNRLNKKKDFQQVFQKGKGIKEDSLIFKWAPNKFKVSRFGFVVSKKVSKKAALRNKIKRKLKEKVRKELGHLKRGIDGVIIVSPKITRKNHQELTGTLIKIFHRAKIIKKK